MSYLFIVLSTSGGLKLSVLSGQPLEAHLGEEGVRVDIFLSLVVFWEFCRLHLPRSCHFRAQRVRWRRLVGLRHLHCRTRLRCSATAFVQVCLEVLAKALTMSFVGLVCEFLSFTFVGGFLLQSVFGSPWTPLHFWWGDARPAGLWRL